MEKVSYLKVCLFDGPIPLPKEVKKIRQVFALPDIGRLDESEYQANLGTANAEISIPLDTLTAIRISGNDLILEVLS